MQTYELSTTQVEHIGDLSRDVIDQVGTGVRARSSKVLSATPHLNAFSEKR